MSSENKPVHRIRLSAVSAAIFKNESGEGDVYYTTRFDRSYKDGEDWKHTQSFGHDDTLKLSKVADLVHTWIHQQVVVDTSHSLPPGNEPS